MVLDKPVLILKTGATIDSLRARGEDFEHWFGAGCGLGANEYRVCQLYLGEALPALAEISAIIVTGSPAFVTDGDDWNYTAAEYLRAAQEAAIAILGVCYGHQLLAWAFGGEVGFHPQGRQMGSRELSLTAAGQEDRLLGSGPPRFVVQVSHQQSVLRLPPQAVRLGSSDNDPNYAFRLGARSWGLQFHPEFDVRVIRAYVEARAAVLAQEGQNPGEIIARLRQSPISAGLLPRFLDLAAVAETA